MATGECLTNTVSYDAEDQSENGEFQALLNSSSPGLRQNSSNVCLVPEPEDEILQDLHSSGAIDRIVRETTEHHVDENQSNVAVPISQLPDSAEKTIEDDTEEISTELNYLMEQPAERKMTVSNDTDDKWKQHEKHVFILGTSGKPIYTRYGDEGKLVTLMGVMQALVSFVENENDELRSVTAGDRLIVFSKHEHMILVCVSRASESASHLHLYLKYVFNQIVSVLTLSRINSIMSKRRNYDLRRLLAGAERLIDSIINYMEIDFGPLLNAVRCLPLPATLRDTIATCVSQGARSKNSNIKDLVFGILLANDQLVAMVHMKGYHLHPLDIHLIINLIRSSSGFRNAESWSPICLPKFDTSGYLYAYVSYLNNDACLLLLTPHTDQFFALHDCKERIVERMEKFNCLTAISDAIRTAEYSTVDVNLPQLRHFLVKSRSLAQYTSSSLVAAPYLDEQERHRLLGCYYRVHHLIHQPGQSLRLVYHCGAKETILGWVADDFELYAAFSPLATKNSIITATNRLRRWLNKEETRLFITSSTNF